MTKAAHQIQVTVPVGVLDLAIAWGERLIQHGISDNGCRTASLEQDVAWLKQIAEKGRQE
jgi:hypothetical protein